MAVGLDLAVVIFYSSPPPGMVRKPHHCVSPCWTGRKEMVTSHAESTMLWSVLPQTITPEPLQMKKVLTAAWWASVAVAVVVVVAAAAAAAHTLLQSPSASPRCPIPTVFIRYLSFFFQPCSWRNSCLACVKCGPPCPLSFHKDW